jgi:hypothetical protein
MHSLYFRTLFVLAHLLIFAGNSSAQDYRQYIPFRYNNLYGLVDQKQETFIEPVYRDMRVIGDYHFAVFDNVLWYNLKTGEHKEIAMGSNYLDYVIIGDEVYTFDREKNQLINLFTGEEIKLKLKYDLLLRFSLYDVITKTSYNYIRAYTLDNKLLILSDSKELKMVVPFKLDHVEADFFEEELIGNYKRRLGMAAIINNEMVYFSADLKKKLIFKGRDIEQNPYSISLKPGLEKKIAEFYGTESENYLTTLSKVERLEPMNISYNTSYFNEKWNNVSIGNGYELKRGKRYSYEITSINDSKGLPARFQGAEFHSNSYAYKLLSFILNDKKCEIFISHPNINPTIIMFPKKYLLELGFDIE